MSTKTTRALVCDGCATEFETAGGTAEKMAIDRAEAGWRQFTLQLRGRTTVHACPGCSPRAIADRLLAERDGRLAARRACEEELLAALAAKREAGAQAYRDAQAALTPDEREVARIAWKSEYDAITGGGGDEADAGTMVP